MPTFSVNLILFKNVKLGNKPIRNYKLTSTTLINFNGSATSMQEGYTDKGNKKFCLKWLIEKFKIYSKDG